MGITISGQAVWFAVSVGLGVVMGTGDFLLSLLYILTGLNRWTAALMDIVWFMLCGISAFLFMVIFLNGSVRIYPWAGMALGAFPVWALTSGFRSKIQRRIRLRRRKQEGSPKKEMLYKSLYKRTKKPQK